MERFVDRENEMRALEAEYARDGASLVILYGRRRVGKTSLITAFIRNKPALFFLASEESEAQNRRQFRYAAAAFAGNALLQTADSADWDTIFRVILSGTYPGKPVVVIDEFQYIGKSDPAFPSIFQRIWEEQLKGRNVMVILCGSLISMMESQTLRYDSPLYGRRTAQIRLKPIPFRYYADFFPNRTLRERIEMYAVTGGVPKYMELFQSSGDIYDAIEKNILDPYGYLYDEPTFLLQQEVSEIGSYFSLIRAIAAGNTKLSAIAGVLEVKATSLTRYLKTLIDLDILEREVPVTEESPEKSKRGLYKIKDNYLRFWFRFVYPMRSFLEVGSLPFVKEKIRAGFLSGQVAFVYEDICRERMWELNLTGTWSFHFTRIGRYWDNEVEIDIVALEPESGSMIVGECKYHAEPVGREVLSALITKARHVPFQAKTVRYVLFSISGFTADLEEYASAREDVVLDRGE